MPRSTKTPSRSPPSSQDRGYFAQTPLLLLNDAREGITSYTLAVYAAIHSYITFGKTTGAHPNTEQIADRAHCSTRTVERERELLKELGYLTWIPGNFKRHQGNAYTLFPSGRGSIDRPTDGNRGSIDRPTDGPFPSDRRLIDRPTDGTQRTMYREPVTEKYKGKSANRCSHPDTACCRNCLTPTVVSRPVSPPSPPKSESQTQNDEDF
jgi:hypothetical protein